MTSRTAGSVPLAEVERVLEEACGLTLSPGIRRTLGDAFLRAARELHIAPEPFLARLRAREHRAVTSLVEAAVVGETYFFRHPEQLAAVRRLVFASAPRDRGMRIWSAGCATGEEPYTLAMELADAGRAGMGDEILATDVSSRALAVGKEARYGEWSLRRLDRALRARHFVVHPLHVEVQPQIRAAVRFQRHNLVRDPPPGTGFDLVLCRNVLIYFNAPNAALVVEKLVVSLAPGGFLVLGPVETPLAAGQDLERIELDGVTVFRARGGAALPEAARPREARARPRVAALRLVEGRRHPARRHGGSPPPPAAEATTPPVPASAAPPELRPVAEERPVDAPPEAPLEAARQAAVRGDLESAEALARAAATRELCPEAWLLVSMVADARGDLAAAVDATRRALYLDPGLALGHATLLSLYDRLGRPEEAARARRNALEALAGLDDAAPLRGTDAMTAGALRSALENNHRPGRSPGARSGSQG